MSSCRSIAKLVRAYKTFCLCNSAGSAIPPANKTSEAFDAVSRNLDSGPVVSWSTRPIYKRTWDFSEAAFGRSCAFEVVNLNSAETAPTGHLLINLWRIRSVPGQLYQQEISMEIDENKEFGMCKRRTETLLFIADFVNGSQDVLDLACEIAAIHNANLQLLHVIDPEHAPSSPDGQMGSQFSLEMLADRMRALKRSAVSLLSFGSPEYVIPRRAAEVNATVVVIPLNGSATDRLQKRLIKRLRGKCDCPVLAISPMARKGMSTTSFSLDGLFSSIRKVCGVKVQSMGERTRSGDQQGLRGSLAMMPKSVCSLRR
jgi:hypothetical protein